MARNGKKIKVLSLGTEKEDGFTGIHTDSRKPKIPWEREFDLVLGI